MISGSLSTRHGTSSGCGWRNSPQGVVLQLVDWARWYQLLTVKTGLVTKQIHVPQTWTDPLIRPKQWKWDMTFSTWNARSLDRSGSFTTAARELASYKLHLVGVRRLGRTKGAW